MEQTLAFRTLLPNSHPVLSQDDETLCGCTAHSSRRFSLYKRSSLTRILETEGIAEHMFGILDPNVAAIQLCKFARTCHWAWALVRKDELWRQLYMCRWPDEWTDELTPEELKKAAASHGWLQLFSDRHRRSRSGVAWERYLHGGEWRLSGHTEFVSALVELNGAVYSGSLDGTIRRWDRTTFREVATLRTECRIWSLAVWGTWLASSHGDGSIRLWDTAAPAAGGGNGGTCVHVLRGHGGEVNTLAACGRWLVSGSDDTTVRVWSLSPAEFEPADPAGPAGITREEDAVLARAHRPALTDASASDAAAAMDASGSDIGGGGGGGGGPGRSGWRLERTLEGHTDKVYALAVWERKAVSGSVDATIRVWDVASGAAEAVLRGHANAVTARLLVHGRRLLSCSRDRTVRAWAVGTWECRAAVQAYPPEGPQRVYCLAAAGGRLVTGSADTADDVDPAVRYELRVWDADRLEVIHTLPQPPGEEVYTLLAPAAGGGQELWAGVGCSVVVWGWDAAHHRPPPAAG